MSKWIEFIDLEHRGITKVWRVTTKVKARYGMQIGIINWYSPWRRYTFFPHQGTMYEPTCLKDIAGFIEEQMRVRKQEKEMLRGFNKRIPTVAADPNYFFLGESEREKKKLTKRKEQK